MDVCWENVSKFHRAFGVSALDRPEFLESKRALSRADWMREEIQEFLDASTIEEQADAMIDLIYFALGTMVEMGVRPQEIFDIVHNANMGKIWPDGKVHKRDDGKLIKPSNWAAPEPMIEAAIARQRKAYDDSNKQEENSLWQ